MPFDFTAEGTSDLMDGLDGDVQDQGPEALVPGTPSGYTPDEIVDQLLSEPPEEEDYAKVLSQVDRRMRVAHFYRSILDSELFSEKTSEAMIVQNRIRKFCNDELEVIFGMRSATAPAGAGQFTEEEVKLLKDLIARKVAMIEEARSKPQPKPVVNRVAPKPASTVRTIQTQNKPAAPPPPKPAVRQQSHEKPVSQKPAAGKVDLRIPERYRNDPTARVQNGKVFVQARGDGGELLYRTTNPTNGEPISTPVPIMRDVTPSAVPTASAVQPLLMPSMGGGASSQFNQVMQGHADSSLRALERASNLPGIAGNMARQMGGSLVHSLSNVSNAVRENEDEYER